MGSKSTPETRALNIDCATDLYERLRAHCEAEGRTKKWVIEKALAEWLDAHESKEPKKKRD